MPIKWNLSSTNIGTWLNSLSLNDSRPSDDVVFETYDALLAEHIWEYTSLSLFVSNQFNFECIEVNAEVVLKATNVDGVYDDNPKHNPDARLQDNLTYHDVISKELSVMDLTAITLCQENNIPGTRLSALDSFYHFLDDSGVVIGVPSHFKST